MVNEIEKWIVVINDNVIESLMNLMILFLNIVFNWKHFSFLEIKLDFDYSDMFIKMIDGLFRIVSDR